MHISTSSTIFHPRKGKRGCSRRSEVGVNSPPIAVPKLCSPGLGLRSLRGTLRPPEESDIQAVQDY